MLAGLLLVSCLTAGCAQKVQGSALAGAEPAVPATTSTGSGSAKPTDNPLESAPPSGAPAMEQKLCKLLTFDDLPFKSQGGNATTPLNETNISKDFDQSCRWTYEILNPKTKVGAQLYYRKVRDLAVKDPTGTYTVSGRAVLYQQGDQNSCVLSLKYADGNVGIGVIDSSGLFGPQCEVGRKIAETILQREPSSLS
jgi:Protein of unknown function (DUF3558)